MNDKHPELRGRHFETGEALKMIYNELDTLIKQMTNAKDSTMTGANGKDKARRFAEVTTPIWLIDRQLDLLPKSAFALDKTVLDPCTGDGRYLMRYVLRRIDDIKTQDDLIQAFSTLYGYDLQHCNVTRARDNMQQLAQKMAKIKGFDLPSQAIKQVLTSNITQKDFINAHQNQQHWRRYETKQ